MTIHPHTWEGWTLDVEGPALVFDPWYEIDLLRCTTSAQLLDWIFQVRPKIWVTPKILAGLLRALDDVLAPQATLCGSGEDGVPLSQSRVTALVGQAVRQGAPRYGPAAPDGQSE